MVMVTSIVDGWKSSLHLPLRIIRWSSFTPNARHILLGDLQLISYWSLVGQVKLP